jgi:periplasmic protein TonB
MADKDEKKNHAIGIITSVGIHVALLIAFLFMIAWRAPNPPLPEYGIELNFGLDDSGGGEIQPDNPVGATEEIQEEASKEKPEEVKEQPVSETKPQESKSEEEVVSKLESPVVVKEVKKESKVVEKPKEKEKTEPKTETIEAKKEIKKEVSVADAKKAAADASKTGEKGSQGDDSKIGDKGSPEGSLDAKALYGKQGGGGGGFALQMAGWSWDEQPKAPKLPDNENGRVVFEIEVDETGEITSIKTIERSLSPEAEKICRQEIEKRSLVRTSSGVMPERSKGRVAFVLRTQ